MDEWTAYGVVMDKLHELHCRAEEERLCVEMSRPIVAALPEAYQKQFGAAFDELAAAVTVYDMAVAEAAQNR